MAKKIKHPEHVNAERWLISYVDFITLLFILFIILYSFSQVDIKKYKQVAHSLSSEFGGGGSGGGGGPVDGHESVLSGTVCAILARVV